MFGQIFFEKTIFFSENDHFSTGRWYTKKGVQVPPVPDFFQDFSEFSAKGIKLRSIYYLNENILSGSIQQAYTIEDTYANKKEYSSNDNRFQYNSDLERYFWILYLKHLPIACKQWPRFITMNISTEFLNTL